MSGALLCSIYYDQFCRLSDNVLSMCPFTSGFIFPILCLLTGELVASSLKWRVVGPCFLAQMLRRNYCYNGK